MGKADLQPCNGGWRKGPVWQAGQKRPIHRSRLAGRPRRPYVHIPEHGTLAVGITKKGRGNYDMGFLKEIATTEMKGLKIGNAQNEEAMTGVTVLLFDHGATIGVDVSGGGPASRETLLASPLTADNPVHAIVLSGGSAFGLAASDGVMKYLEEHGIGFPTGFAKVPLVCQSCIYDLGIGKSQVRPDAAMGYAACVDAQDNRPACGNIGGGTGATVGKLYGMGRAMKSGLGLYAVQAGPLQLSLIHI